jgi:hypothetical protein
MPIKKTLPKPAVKAPAPSAKKSVPVAKPPPIAEGNHRALPPLNHNPNLKALAQNEHKLGLRPDPSKLPGAEREAASLEGQTWQFVNQKGEIRTCTFFEDGSINFNGSPGQWLQHGAAMTLNVNERYVDYIGVIDGDTMSGSSKNVTGYSWEWTSKRLS